MGRIWGCRRASRLARCLTSAYFTGHDALRSRTKRMLGQRATCSIKRQTLQLVPILTKQIEGVVWGAVQRGWQSAWWPSGSSAEHDDIRTTRKATTARPCSLRRSAADSALPSGIVTTICILSAPDRDRSRSLRMRPTSQVSVSRMHYGANQKPPLMERECNPKVVAPR